MSRTGRGTTAATPSTRRSCARSAGSRAESGRAASARTTRSSTRRGCLAVLLSLRAQAVDSRLAALDRLGLVEEVEHAVAVAQVIARVREVVLRVRLVEDPRAVE